MSAFPPTVAPPPAAPAPPPPLSTLNEKASQLAPNLSSQQQFEAALASVPGASVLPPQAKGQLWDTVQKTRVGQGLPPMTIGAPGAPPGGAPVVGGAAPVSAATNAALPASVTGAPRAAPAPAAPGATPPPAAPGLKQVPGQEVPLEQAPPAPTAQYQAPDLLTPTYTPPKYEPPKKGLEYAAMALALLFPGAPIARAAAGFAQGLNVGAQQKYGREEQQAKDAFEAERTKDATINQGRIAQAQGNLTAAEQYDKWVAQKTATGNTNADRIFTQRQEARKSGTNPDTGAPMVPPANLQKPPPPAAGYAGLAQWHTARALWFAQQGATGPNGPAAQEDTAAKAATTQAIDAANNARALAEAYQRQQVEVGLAGMREDREDRRANARMGFEAGEHAKTIEHEDARALLADQGRRAEFGVRASAADKSLFTTWQQYTKPQTKTITIKDPSTGNATGYQTVPLQTVRTDAKGNPVKDSAGNVVMDPVLPPITGTNAAALQKMVNLVRSDTDPQGAAAHYSAHLGSDAYGLAAQEILQQAGEAGALRLMANGNLPKPHAWAPIVMPAAPDLFKAAGINRNDPAVKTQIDAAHAAGVTDDNTIITTLKAHGIGAPPPPPAASIPLHGRPTARPAFGGSQGAAGPSAPGQLEPGTIDIHHRPVVHNPDGSISTVRSITITDDRGRAILIPTVVNNRVVSNAQAVAHYKATGQHLGIFSSEDAADKYAESLHREQAAEYLPK